jgi:GntR family transcriptional regulator, transcriptional repressor for pyruvate dehydrogenase complex
LHQQLRSSAVDSIVANIRGLIADRGLGVGDSLPTERELCERFSTSRNTVREAMRILKAYGIVEVRPKVGATITDNRMARAFELFSFDFPHISRETFADVQGLRILLEVASADRMFERATPEDVTELREINALLLHPRSVADASEVDFRFHLRLVSILGNRAILDVYRMMKPVILRIMANGKTRRTFETSTFREHDGVVEALAARDRIVYQYRLRTHLEWGLIHFDDTAEAEALGAR